VSWLAACGGGGSTSPSPSAGGPAKVASIASEVPDAVKAQSPLQIATDATYAPNEFINPENGQIQGWDIDLGNAACKVMGLVCTFSNVTFSDIIAQLKASTPAEQANGDKPRYQFSISSWSPTQRARGQWHRLHQLLQGWRGMAGQSLGKHDGQFGGRPLRQNRSGRSRNRRRE